MAKYELGSDRLDIQVNNAQTSVPIRIVLFAAMLLVVSPLARAQQPPAANGASAALTAVISDARKLAQDGQPQKALDLLKQFVREHPGAHDANKKIAILLREMKRYDESLQVIRLHITQHPDDDNGWSVLGGICIEMGDFNKALQAYGIAAEKNPTEKLYPFHQGAAFLQLNQPSDAVAAYQRAAAIDPQDSDTHAMLALAHLRLGRLGYASKEANKAMTSDSSGGLAWGVFAICRAASGDNEGAEKNLRECVVREPSRELEMRDELKGLALRLSSGNKLDEALNAAQFCADRFPAEADSWNLLGRVLTLRSAPADAIKAYSQGIRVNDKYLANYLDRGVVFTQVGEYDKALQDYKHLQSLSPKYPGIHRYLSHAYLRKKQFRASIEQANLAIRDDPADDYAIAIRGVAHWTLSEMELAEADFANCRRGGRQIQDFVDRECALLK